MCDKIALLTEQARVLQATATETEAEKHQYEDRIGSLEALVASKTATIGTLSQQLDKIHADSRTELERLSQSLSAKVSEVDEAEKRYAELLEVSKAERGQLASLQAELNHRTEKVGALEQELDDAQRQTGLELKAREESAAKLRSELVMSSQAVRMLSDQLKRIEADHKAAMGSAEQQIADLQGETDLLRLILRTQQGDAVKDRAEREEMGSALDDTKAALVESVAQFEQANAKLVVLESCHATELEVRNTEAARQLTAAQDALASSSEWKEAWSRSIVQCGALKLQLSAEAIEKRRLEQELLLRDAATKQLVIELDALRSELGVSNEAKLTLEVNCANLATDVGQLNGQISDMRDQIRSLESCERQREADYMELQLLLTLAEKEKRRLQTAVEQSESAPQTRHAEYAAAVEEHAVREQELEACGAERVAELEAMLAFQTTDARDKEADLLTRLDQVNALVGELTTRALESEQQLEGERESVRSLKLELQNCQAEIADREASVAILQASVDARDDTIADHATQIAKASVDHQTLMGQCTTQEQAMKELATQCEDLREQAAQAHEWKHAWTRSIAECGALQLQVTSMKAEALELDEALASALSRAKAQDTEVALLRSELRRALGISSGLETARAELEAEYRLRGSQLAEVQAEVRVLTARAQHSEADLLRLEQVHRDTEEKKRALQEQAKQSATRACEPEAALADQTTSHAAFVQELENRHLAKEQELEQSIALASQNVIEQGACWQEKEAALRAQTADANEHLQRLASLVYEIKGQLEREQEKAAKLSVEVVRAQIALTECEATNLTMREQLAQQNDLIASVKSRHEEIAAQRQSLEEHCSKLQGGLMSSTAENQELTRQVTEQSARYGSECAAAVATAVQQTSQRLREAEATAFMQLAELESFRWWIAAQPDGFRRRNSAELLDQAVAAYNVEPSEEAKRAVMQHLSSLDEWFEKTIVGGLPDDATPSSLDISSTTCSIENASVVSPLPIQVETTAVDLDKLTNELLELCSTTKTTEMSRTDTLETIRMPSVAEMEDVDEEDDEDEETTISTKFEDVFGESLVTIEPAAVGDNNAGDGGDSEASKTTGDDVRNAKASTSEPETSTSDAEVAQLK